MNKASKRKPERSLDDTLTELAQLSPVEYDLRRSSEAERLGIRVSTLDKEVEKHCEPNGAESAEGGKQVQFEKVDPWPEPVDAMFSWIASSILFADM